MQIMWMQVFAVAVLFLLTSDARPSSSKKRSNTAVRIEGLDINELEKRVTNPGKGKGKKKGYTKDEIDAKEVDVNSELQLLLETMAVNGQSPKGLRSDLKATTKAMRLEQKHLIKSAKEKGKGKGKGKPKRNFMPQLDEYNFDKYWPQGIVPYYVDWSIFSNSVKAKQTIQAANDDFMAKTCVKLVYKTAEQLSTENIEYYVNITNKPGCYSLQGRYDYSEDIYTGQPINLQEDGCMIKSTVLHEFCHALGMAHEQSRSDRDKHLKVLFENIAKDEHDQLTKYYTLDVNPYDYYSLMQYELGSFVSKSWAKSMEFRDPYLEFLAGTSPDLTFYDVMDITKAYKCSAKCQQKDDSCKNCGFIDHTCKCYCPEGLTGADCNTIASTDCGGIIDLQPGQDKVIKSPNYPNNYDLGKVCYWLLRAQSNTQRVMIEVQDFDVAANNELGRCYHWLEPRYNLIGQPGKKNCGNKFYSDKISSTTFGNPELMMLKFDTATVTGSAAKKGFSLKARAIETANSKGCTTSPPTVDNSSNDYAEVGSSIGAIVHYKCNYLYHKTSEVTSSTCEADGTWSNVGFQCIKRDPIFQCDFNNGNCGVSISSEGQHKWTVEKENGTSYFTVSPGGIATASASFTLPTNVNSGKSYCLSFKFQRTRSSQKCSRLSVGDKWDYSDCQQGQQEIFQGNIGQFDDGSKITFTAYTKEEAGDFNMRIDDIFLSEWGC